jgi:DNA-binding IclR family transcriptional regulator
MLPYQPNESLIGGLSCLRELAVSVKPVGVREMSRRLGMEPTRVNRLLKTLAHIGVAAQTNDRKYVPGPGMHVLAAQCIFASGLLRRAIVPLEELGKYGMITALGVLWKDRVSYLYHALPGMKTSDAIGRVALFPSTLSSIGMILLSHLPEKEIREIYAGKEIPGYPKGIKELLPVLRRFRAKGFSVVSTKGSVVNTSIACAIGIPPGAAVALSGKIARRDQSKFHKILMDTASKIGGEK